MTIDPCIEWLTRFTHVLEATSCAVALKTILHWLGRKGWALGEGSGSFSFLLTPSRPQYQEPLLKPCRYAELASRVGGGRGWAWQKAAKGRGSGSFPSKKFCWKSEGKSCILDTFGIVSHEIMLLRFVCWGRATFNYIWSIRYAMAQVSGARAWCIRVCTNHQIRNKNHQSKCGLAAAAS